MMMIAKMKMVAAVCAAVIVVSGATGVSLQWLMAQEPPARQAGGGGKAKPETAEVIADAKVVTVRAVKTTSAVVSWHSIILAETSQLEYGPETSYGNITPEEPLSYFHRTRITGLSPGKTYHFRIRSKDWKGVDAITPDYTFTTRTQRKLDAVIRAARADKGLPKTYYVKPDGNDSHNGLNPATAWKTPSFAVSKADAGDTIYLLAGTWQGQEIVFRRSGIDVAPITLSRHPVAKDAVFLKGKDGYKGLAISLENAHDLIIHGLIITGYRHAIWGYWKQYDDLLL